MKFHSIGKAMWRRWLPGTCLVLTLSAQGQLTPQALRVEYHDHPWGVDTPQPRLSWQLHAEGRGQKQTAYQVLVASRAELLENDQGDLWDSGKVSGDRTIQVVYAGKPLASRQRCMAKVRSWNQDDQPSAWSSAAEWTMGLLEEADWTASWISHRDNRPLQLDRARLYLPPPCHYRKSFETRRRPIRRATVYLSALGIVDFYLNGRRVSDRYFAPGWSDYAQRAYYVTYDVTDLMRQGPNVAGAILAEGWYSGYVGYGLLVGYGPGKSGRYFYGKTPAWLAQLEIEYDDGDREIIGTDTTWKTTDEGPIREADLIMGEVYDARRELGDWSAPGFDDKAWSTAIPAADNASAPAVFFDNRGERKVDVGFVKPPRLQSYSAPPIVITETLPARQITEPQPGVYIFDLGQNFAGVVRLHVRGPSGTQLTLRYGEMLHPDGRLMTENLRRARATDTYILKGDPQGETWVPRFTYHGFQFVEVTGLPARPDPGTITGLVLHNDTPLRSTFACSDEIMTRFWQNTRWTQRANFVELPTDCPQRDERLGWMGDAQVYIRTATFNADVAAFFTKWLDDVEEAQLHSGAYPDYCPYPMGHGAPQKNFGTAWTDAGIICPWTIWQVYGDTRVLERHWNSMTRFMDWRAATMADSGLGVSIGNTWGDWLNVNESTPIEFIDTCYHAWDCGLMAEMARALGRGEEAEAYEERRAKIRAAFQAAYVTDDGNLTVDTQTAYALAIHFGLLPADKVPYAARRLAAKITENDTRMTTGFLGTKQILPALSESGHHELAVRLFQSRSYPSWGYEVVNGANTVWERWDSYTREHGFNGAGGQQNASMNSFSHYSFGAVMEWAFRELAGIDLLEPGYGHIQIHPQPPSPDPDATVPPIDWVEAEYHSIRGPIRSAWRRSKDEFTLHIALPANTRATVFLPVGTAQAISENGRSLDQNEHVRLVSRENGWAKLHVDSGEYRFGVR